MIFKLESFLKRIWWKAYFLEKSNEIVDVTTDNNFGFKFVLTRPKNEHIIAFEEDLYDLVRNIEFKRINAVLQNQLNKDISMINKNPLLFIPGDKFKSLYKVGKDAYNKLL